MKLEDVVAGSGLAIYAEVALVLFFIVFVAVVAWTFWPSRKKELEEAGKLPLEDEAGKAPRPGAHA